MKKRLLSAILTVAIIGSINLPGCQKAESAEGISSENNSSASLSAEPTASEPEEEGCVSSGEENASSQPDLSVNEEGQVVDNKTGEIASGYEVNSDGAVVESSTGTVIIPEKDVKPTPDTLPLEPSTGKPSATTSSKAPGNTSSSSTGNTGGTTTGTKPDSSVSSKPENPASSNPSEIKPSHTHSYAKKTVAATCTEEGYTLHTCSCGDSYKDGQTAALGHNYGEWTVTKEATTTAEGSKTRTCSRCGVKETQSIPKIADKYSAYASTSNVNLIEERVLYYINQYRAAQGSAKATSLPNLKAYAKYRSKQLVSNFAHSVTDERAAATALKYGKYMSKEELESFGIQGEPYYSPGCGEAISYSPHVGETIDELAKGFADAARNSAGHWSYVGHSSNIYIAVGITFGNGNWYLDICTTNTNIYG